MKIKLKYADVMIINPELGEKPVRYIVPNKNFISIEKASNFIRKRFKNVAVLDYENHVCDYEVTDDMIKKYLEDKNND